MGKNRLLTIFSRPYTVPGGKKRGFFRLFRVAAQGRQASQVN
jgi:hypothetical protein